MTIEELIAMELRVDVDQVVEELRQFRKDNLFLDAHRSQWVEEYPDCWVMVYHEEFIGHARTLAEVKEIANSKGIPMSHMAVNFLDTNPPTLVLGAYARRQASGCENQC